MTSSIDIRTWAKSGDESDDDLSFAKSMTDHEEWGNSRADMVRLQKLQPQGCFVATQAGERIGMITSITYGSYGFLGSLIVTESERGKQVGERLMAYAIDYLRTEGVTTIELDGVLRAIPLYQRLGFKEKYHSLRFQRPAGEAVDINSLCLTDRTRKLGPTDIDEIIRFDQACLGLDRTRILRLFMTEFPGSFYGIFDAEKRLVSYLIARPIHKDSCQLGPLVTLENAAAVELLSTAIRDSSARVLSIGLPAAATYICHWILRQGFVRYPPTLRMYLGAEVSYEKNLACILSPEKG